MNDETALPGRSATNVILRSKVARPAGDTPRDRLICLFSPDVVAAFEQFVVERVAAELEAAPRGDGSPPWLTVEQAAERLGCSTDAVRRRAKRGRLESRHMGRTVYLSAASVDRLA